MTTITLDQATHANHYSYSDITPYEIIKKVSAKTIDVRRMKATMINMDEMKFHTGGFSANCSNQNDQKYTFESDENEIVERLRLNKDGVWCSKYGDKHRLNIKPIRFYDFNF